MANQNNGAVPERVDFSKIKTSIPIPNLIEVQKKSYERFLQMDSFGNCRIVWCGCTDRHQENAGTRKARSGQRKNSLGIARTRTGKGWG